MLLDTLGTVQATWALSKPSRNVPLAGNAVYSRTGHARYGEFRVTVWRMRFA
jgi:hypothetical protein